MPFNTKLSFRSRSPQPEKNEIKTKRKKEKKFLKSGEFSFHSCCLISTRVGSVFKRFRAIFICVTISEKKERSTKKSSEAVLCGNKFSSFSEVKIQHTPTLIFQ